MATIDTQGIALKRGDAASPEVFTIIGQITGIRDAGKSRALIDITNLDSTSREWKLAIKDGKEINFTAQYDPADAPQTGLSTDLDNGTIRNFSLTLTDSPATVWTFAALVIEWATNYEIDNVGELNVTIKPTGDITIT